MKKVLLGMLIFVSFILPKAHAEEKDSSIYCGIGLGLAKFEGGTIVGVEFIPGQELKDETEIYDVFIGYQANKYLSFELGYVDFGEVSEEFTLDPDIVFIVAPNDTLTVEGNGFTLASLLEYPVVERFNIFGLFGFSYFDVGRELSGGFDPGIGFLANSLSDSEIEFSYGLGFKFRLNDRFRIRLQWKHYDMEITEADVAGIAIEYRF